LKDHHYNGAFEVSLPLQS